MDNLRNKTRIETQHMVNVHLGSQALTEKKIRAMILNISMDGALIETAEPVQQRSLILANAYKNQTVSIHAKVIHHQNAPHEERVFGSYRTGLHFLNNTVGARDFIISIIKAQEVNVPQQASLKKRGPQNDPAPKYMDREPKPEPPSPNPEPVAQQPDPAVNTKEDKPSSFKEMVEQTLSEKNDKPDRMPIAKAPTLITALTFILLAGSLFIFRTPAHDKAASLTEKLGIDIPFFVERSMLPRTDTFEPVNEVLTPKARLLKDTIESTIVKNTRLGPLFVIRGYIKLEPEHRPEEVNIQGKLIDTANKIVASMTIWPGNRIENDAIAEFDSNDLAKVRDYTPETGYRFRTPFVIIFQDIPRDTRSFSVDLTFNSLF